MKRLTNRETGAAVTALNTFSNKNKTIYGKRDWSRGLYVVYSYNDTWPLYAFDWGLHLNHTHPETDLPMIDIETVQEMRHITQRPTQKRSA
jgi:hypothetical protein